MNKIAIAITVAFLLLGKTFGVEVAPGCFTSQFVPVGHPQDLGFSFVVSGVEDSFVTVGILTPEQSLFEVEGYIPLPNTQWFHIGEGKTLYVDKSGVARANMWTDFPDDPRLRNSHFLVQVLVFGGSKGFLEPVIVTNYFIETEPDSNPKAPPFGPVGVAPSIITAPQDNPVAEFTLFNNTDSVRTYSFIVRTPQRESRKAVNLSPGFSPVPDTTKFVFYPREIEILAHARQTVRVRWLEAGAIDPKTEAVIMITDDRGNANFVRFQLESNSH